MKRIVCVFLFACFLIAGSGCKDHTVSSGLGDAVNTKLNSPQLIFQKFIGMDVVRENQPIGVEATVSFNGKMRLYVYYLTRIDTSGSADSTRGKELRMEGQLSVKDMSSMYELLAGADFYALPELVPVPKDGTYPRWPADSYNVSFRSSPDDDFYTVNDYTGRGGDYPDGYVELREGLLELLPIPEGTFF